MTLERGSGVFLHPTSLPGPYGIGSFDDAAERFVDVLADAGQSVWQVCPLGPTSEASGYSPYQSPSAFAGNPMLVSLDRLAEAGWLDDEDLPDREFDADEVDYESVVDAKEACLRTAFERFEARAGESEREAVADFRARNDWVDEYGLFVALKGRFDGKLWTEWPEEAKLRDEDAMDRYREELAEELRYRAFVQYEFDRQWRELKSYADERGVDVLGDMPIYVSLDSADVWANPDVFMLDEDNEPTHVAGVPPFMGDSGQRWGNPLYDWGHLQATGYEWWVDRFEHLLDTVDLVRLDHFRGFESYWAIPADADDPAAGEWWDGPGMDLFYTVEGMLGQLPLVAEDLGFVSEEVQQLRGELGAPGMKVLQYAEWDQEDHMYLPHTYPTDSVAYTATHDTDTAVGWYWDLSDHMAGALEYYLDSDGSEIHWDLVEAAWESDSVLAMTTVQDLLGLGSEARFNTPGTAEGNWRWRVTDDQLAAVDVERLRDVTERTDRV